MGMLSRHRPLILKIGISFCYQLFFMSLIVEISSLTGCLTICRTSKLWISNAPTGMKRFLLVPMSKDTHVFSSGLVHLHFVKALCWPSVGTNENCYIRSFTLPIRCECKGNDPKWATIKYQNVLFIINIEIIESQISICKIIRYGKNWGIIR